MSQNLVRDPWSSLDRGCMDFKHALRFHPGGSSTDGHRWAQIEPSSGLVDVRSAQARQRSRPRILLRQCGRDATNQFVGNWPSQGEPEVPLVTAIRSQFVLKFVISLHWRVYANMLLECREIEEHPVELERRHLITDRLGRCGNRFSDDLPYSLKDVPDLR
jgi:hypothetical protein